MTKSKSRGSVDLEAVVVLLTVTSCCPLLRSGPKTTLVFFGSEKDMKMLACAFQEQASVDSTR